MSFDVNYSKNKYLKYKNKYLKYKNQNGGIQVNNDLTKCLDNPNYPHYLPIDNACCSDNKRCYKYAHDIYYKHAQQSNERFTIPSDTIGRYLINAGIELHIHADTKIKIYKAFNLNKYIYSFAKVLGKGAFGLVVQYYNNELKNYIAVKYGDIAAELKVIEQLKTHADACSELLIKYIIHESIHDNVIYRCIIMENASGTLADLIPATKQNKKLVIDIVYAIMIAIKCLYNINLFYTDIKLQNILYYYTNKGIQIILGDLGSIIDGNGNPVASIPPPDIKSTPKEYVKTRLITWGIGILILLFIGIPNRYLNNSLSYKNQYVIEQIKIKNNTKYLDEEITKIKFLVSSIFPAILPLIDLTLSATHKVESTQLIKIIEEINKLRILANININEVTNTKPESSLLIADPMQITLK